MSCKTVCSPEKNDRAMGRDNSTTIRDDSAKTRYSNPERDTNSSAKIRDSSTERKLMTEHREEIVVQRRKIHQIKHVLQKTGTEKKQWK